MYVIYFLHVFKQYSKCQSVPKVVLQMGCGTTEIKQGKVIYVDIYVSMSPYYLGVPLMILRTYSKLCV